MLDGNVLLRQKRDEVPKGTLSCPDRNLAVFHHYRHYEGLRLLPSVCEQIIIQQTLNNRARMNRGVFLNTNISNLSNAEECVFFFPPRMIRMLAV